jgi:hypothetical protein
MHRRYNTIQTEALHEVAEKIQRYTANTITALALSAVSGQGVCGGNSIVGA